MSASGLLGTLGSLALTIGLLLLALGLLRRWSAGRFGGGRHGPPPLTVLHRVPTGPRQCIALLQVVDRVLVVAISQRGARLLAELDGEARARVLAPSGPSTGSGTRPASARWSLPAWLPLVVALALSPAALGAQVHQPAPPRAPAVATPPAPSIVTPQVEVRIGQGQSSLELSGAVGIVVLMGALTLLPTLFLLMTSFTRILVALHFLRMSMGTQNTPPSQLLIAMSVLLTAVVMQPTLQEANRTALQPYLNGQIGQTEAYRAALVPFRRFMLANTRDRDLDVFAEMSGADSVRTVEELPTVTVMSAFVTSELRTAFQIGFVIFLPFVVIDLIVASVLVSMGMFMLPPVMIALPFKLLLFVLADGWTLIVVNLVAGFHQ